MKHGVIIFAYYHNVAEDFGSPSFLPAKIEDAPNYLKVPKKRESYYLFNADVIRYNRYK